MKSSPAGSGRQGGGAGFRGKEGVVTPGCRRDNGWLAGAAGRPSSGRWAGGRGLGSGGGPRWSARSSAWWRSSGRSPEHPDTPRRAGNGSPSDSFLKMTEPDHYPCYLSLSVGGGRGREEGKEEGEERGKEKEERYRQR